MLDEWDVIRAGKLGAARVQDQRNKTKKIDDEPPLDITGKVRSSLLKCAPAKAARCGARAGAA